MLIPIFIIVAIVGYVVAYILLLAPANLLCASTSGVQRLRCAQYRCCSTILELLFTPIEFIDFLFRDSFWIQNDMTDIEKENPGIASQLKLIERIGSLGGFVIWDDESVSVSFHEAVLADDELSIFEEFVIVDWLSLSDTGISDSGLQYLTKLNRMWHLDVDGTNVTDNGIERLKTALPDCDVWRGK